MGIPGRRTLTIEKVRKALMDEHGVILHAAQALGVGRNTLYRFIEEHPQLQEVRAEAEESIIDVAERIMMANIQAGDGKTIRWFLDRKGKNRGYSTRVEQTGADGEPLQIEKIERTIVEPEPREEE